MGPAGSSRGIAPGGWQARFSARGGEGLACSPVASDGMQPGACSFGALGGGLQGTALICEYTFPRAHGMHTTSHGPCVICANTIAAGGTDTARSPASDADKGRAGGAGLWTNRKTPPEA